jgi:hypothetical protein
MIEKLHLILPKSAAYTAEIDGMRAIVGRHVCKSVNIGDNMEPI